MADVPSGASSAPDVGVPGVILEYPGLISQHNDLDAIRAVDARVPVTLDTLLEVAARHFRAKGFAGTTTRDLADGLGIQRASLYYHVKNKEEILWKICVRGLDRVVSTVESALIDATDGERIRTLLASHLEATLSDQDMHVVMLVELRALSLPHATELVRRRKEYLHLIQETIASEQKVGKIRSDIDPKVLALALLNLANWTVFWFDPDAVWRVEEICEKLAEIFLNGCHAVGVERRSESFAQFEGRRRDDS